MKNPYEPILKEIASGMLDTIEIKPNFTNNALVDATLIFQTVLFDKIHNLQKDEKIKLKYGLEMAESCGKELRKLIHTYTGLDTAELVQNYSK
jgi:alpha-galactosidase/6-phospho-beta-glucosidase family protein